MTPPNWFGPFQTLPLSLSGFKGLLLHPTHTNTLPANRGKPPASQKICVPPKLCLSSIFSFWHPQTLPVAPMGAPSWMFSGMWGEGHIGSWPWWRWGSLGTLCSIMKVAKTWLHCGGCPPQAPGRAEGSEEPR